MHAASILCVTALIVSFLGTTNCQVENGLAKTNSIQNVAVPKTDYVSHRFNNIPEDNLKMKTYKEIQKEDAEGKKPMFILYGKAPSDFNRLEHNPVKVDEEIDIIDDRIYFKDDDEEKKQVETNAVDSNAVDIIPIEKSVIDVPFNNLCEGGFGPDSKGVCRELWRGTIRPDA